MSNPNQQKLSLLTGVLLAGLVTWGQTAKRPMFGPTGKDNRVLLYQVFGVPLQVPIERGTIVTKNGDTLRGYIDMEKFNSSRPLPQVSYLPYGKEKHGEIRVVPIDSVDYVDITPGRWIEGFAEYKYAPVDNAMWSIIGMTPRVRVCRKNSVIYYTDDGTQLITDLGMAMISDGKKVEIPYPAELTFHSDRYFLGKFILQRYGAKYSRRQLRRQNVIQLILDKENQRLGAHLAKSS
jgi:hypothetical protein